MTIEIMPGQRVVQFGSSTYCYKVRRSDRTTISIVIEPSGQVIVKAPLNIEIEKIVKSVEKKRKWIAKKVTEIQTLTKPVPLIQKAVSGEKVLFKNHLYRLKIHKYDKTRTKMFCVGRNLHIYVNKDVTSNERNNEVRTVLIKWYRERASNYLTERVKKYSSFLSKVPKEVKIRELKLRWGSCTRDGKLFFNWRVMMAPISIIDYVVVHELCHLNRQNHSADFWADVESLLPGYEREKKWLEKNGSTLDLRF